MAVFVLAEFDPEGPRPPYLSVLWSGLGSAWRLELISSCLHPGAVTPRTCGQPINPTPPLPLSCFYFSDFRGKGVQLTSRENTQF